MQRFIRWIRETYARLRMDKFTRLILDEGRDA